jgi:hypothetical protein
MTSLLNDVNNPSGLVKTGPKGSLSSPTLLELFTLFDKAKQELSGLVVLNNRPRSQIHDFVSIPLNLVKHFHNSFMDPAVVEDWHQLPKDIGLSDGPINIRHHDFGFIVPKEDMALYCLASLIQSEFGSIGPFHEAELLYLLAARCLAILQDKVLNLLFSIKGLSLNCLLIS